MRRASLVSLLFVFLGTPDTASAEPILGEFLAETAEERRPRGLFVHCPHCGRAVVAPSPTLHGEIPLAECDPCDLYFEPRRNS